MPVFTPESIANTVSAIAQELDAVVSTTATQAGANPELVNEIKQGVDALRNAASALGQAESASAAQPLLQRIAADINAVLAAVAMLPLPPQATAIVRIVQVLAPTVMAAGSILWPAKEMPAVQRFAQQRQTQQQQQNPNQPQPDPNQQDPTAPHKPPTEPAQQPPTPVRPGQSA